MAVVFPKKNNPYWPLPGDYPDLSVSGQKMARVNAVCLEGRPDLEVASWAFFREHYLFPTAEGGRGPFYKHGAQRSPDMHYKWIFHWEKNQLSVTAAPRSAAKSTLIKENILRKVLSRPHWESVMFLAKQDFVTTAFDDFMVQIDDNERIVADFGELKPPSRGGIWNHSQIKLRNGAMITGLPIMGAALGKRPHEIYFDDVEKDESLVLVPSEHIAGFKLFFFNVVYPMADNFDVRVRVVGTLLSHRTFIYWLHSTKDPRISDTDWKKIFHAVTYMDEDGIEQDEWPEKMGREWQIVQKRRMGPAAYASQYENNPVTEAERILRIHPELNTYWIEDKDGAYANDPLNSQAKMVSHQLAGWEKALEEPVPCPRSLVRPFGEAVAGMRRFITIDWAPTVSETSDFSCIHVMGIENSGDYRDTLWSLDLWLDKKPTEEVIRRAYLMALKWQVPLVAVEAYPVQMEFAKRLPHDLPAMYGEGQVPCRVLEVKFPTAYKKPDKIAGLDWRFKQFRLKLPLDLSREEPYRSLWYQIENFTEDLALLRHDDAIDTLAMVNAKGLFGHSAPAAPDTHLTKDPIQMLKEGEYHYDSGIGVMSGINAGDIPDEVLEEMFQRRWEERQSDEYEPEPDWVNYA